MIIEDSKDLIHILIVEDDVTLTTLWNAIIFNSRFKVKVNWAKSAEAAEKLVLSKLEKNEFYDVVVSDYKLQGEMNGVDLYAKIKPFVKSFILNSAYELKEIEQQSQKISDLIFIRKPLKVESIKAILDNLVSHKSLTT